MLKILQARLQQYMNYELPDFQASFSKGRGTRDQITNIHWIINNSKRLPEKLLLYWLCQSLWLCGWQQTVENFKEIGIPDHLTCLLRKLYAGQEVTVRTGHWQCTGSKLTRVRQDCILSPCLFNLYAEYIMRNARMDKAQAGIKIAGRNIIISDMHMIPPLWQKVKKN